MADLYESPYIFGIHEPGGEQHMADAGRKGWIVFTENIGSDPNDRSGSDYTAWANQGYGVIVRLNNAYKPEGTLPPRDKYDDFARRCANFVRASQGCHIWIIGNEMNFWVERPGAFASQNLPAIREVDPRKRDALYRELPDRFSALHPAAPRSRGGLHGQEIYPEDYARGYTLCRNAVKAVAGHGEDQVLIGAVAPWNIDTKYAGNPGGDWVQYFRDILEALGPNGCDGITLHTYTHGADPALITSGAKMDPPFQDRHFHFLAYRDLMEAIPREMRHLPVYITETDEDHPWEDANRGWVKEAYAEIDRWNGTPGRQQIRALVLYRWPATDRWSIANKSGVIQDFREALQNDYRWRRTSSTVTPGAQLPAAAWKQGDRVFTTTVVRLRKTPGVVDKPEDDTVFELPVGAAATILDGPRAQDNYVWWRIRARIPGGETVEGWSAQALAEDTPLLTPDAPAGGAFRQGQRVFTLDVVRLRRTPGFRDKAADDVLVDMPVDAIATVVGGPRAVDGLIWWQLRFRTAGQSRTGWAAQTAFNGQPLLATSGEAQAPPPAGKYRTGETLFATTFVNVRRTPGYVDKTAEDILVEVPYGASVQVIGGPQDADDLTWWQVVYRPSGGSAVQGWVAEGGTGGEEFFSRTAPPPPPPIQTPAFDTYRVGESVTNISPYEVNLRRTPGYRNKPPDDVMARVPSQALLTLTAGPREADGLFWWQVRGIDSEPSRRGWMAEVSPAGVRLLARALYRNLIHLSTPFRGRFPISQLWGENPQFYSRFTYDGVPLRGHNGIDFALPVGTPLLATDGGVVKEAGFLAGGFGNWVMVGHRWGHSVYAHMHRITVRKGQPVQRREVLGESGNSGNSTGPHVHFSIRIEPYFRGDGWGGYCDPLPFMDQSELVLPVRGLEGAPKLEPTPPPMELPGRPLP